MPEEVAIRAKGECEEAFEGKEFDFVGDIEIGMKKERAVEKCPGKREELLRGKLDGGFKGRESERKA